MTSLSVQRKKKKVSCIAVFDTCTFQGTRIILTVQGKQLAYSGVPR